MQLYEDLVARGLVNQVTDPKAREYLNDRKIMAYAGFDPTSDSLHVGNLLGLVTLRRLQQAGHQIIVLVGGATGSIGDPSGKAQERKLLDREHLNKNVQGISRVVARFVEGSESVRVLNNFDWFKEISMLDFLRDVGKHFTVNYMTAKDSVQTRLQDRENGLSFTEFSYMILQSYDFYHLNKNLGCNLQLGGADQWGNITAGIELIRRKGAVEGKVVEPVFGLTWPLITKADGTKFGKSESGSVWLTADKTKPYDFYQFFLRTQDKDVVQLLNYFTFLTLDEIARLSQSLQTQPEKREAQIALASELTRLVHGADELQKVQAATASLFNADSTNISEMSEESLQQLLSDAPSTAKSRESLIAGIPLIELLVETKLVASKGLARNDIKAGGIYLNNQRVEDSALKVDPSHLIAGKYVILRKGKKNYHTLVFQ